MVGLPLHFNRFVLRLCVGFGLSITTIIASAQSGPLTQLPYTGPNPGNLKFYVHVSGAQHTGRPLVVVLHGCTQTADGIAKQSGWNKLADEYAFNVLYPEQKFLNNPQDCFNWFNEKDVSKDEGEVASIKQAIDFTCAQYKTDKSKVFVYGLSAGAAMGLALMADYPQTFSAGAVLAGGPYKCADNAFSAVAVMVSAKIKPAAEWGDLVREQNPGYKGKYPRLVIMHGQKDGVVDIANAYEIIKQWTNVHNTDAVPDSVISSFAGDADVTKNLYNSADERSVVAFYSVANLGHALPVEPGNGKAQGGETGVFAVDKGFFSTYWIAKDFGLIP